METGRWRIDNPLNQFYSKKQQRDPELLLDDVSEVPRPPEQVEDNPPEKNADAGYAQTVRVSEPLPVMVVPGTDPLQSRFTAHGYTVSCFSGVPKLILAASDNRIRAKLRNIGGSGTDTVYIGSTADEAKADGYPLEDSQDIEITGTVAVWGCVKTTTVTDYSIIGAFVEYAWAVE